MGIIAREGAVATKTSRARQALGGIRIKATMADGKRRILRYAAGRLSAGEQDELAVEEPLEIRVRGRAVSVTMRTPGHDDELAAGFLLTEGLIRRREEVLAIEPCERNEAGNLVNVVLAPQVPVDFEKLTAVPFRQRRCAVEDQVT